MPRSSIKRLDVVEELDIFTIEPKLKGMKLKIFIKKLAFIFAKKFREIIAKELGKNRNDKELILYFEPIARNAFRRLFSRINTYILYRAYHKEKRHIISGKSDIYYTEIKQITGPQALANFVDMTNKCHNYIMKKCYKYLKNNHSDVIENLRS